MRHKLKSAEVVANFDISVSDLMAALIQIFVLLLVATLLKVNEYQGKSQIAEKYEQLSSDLYVDLSDEFSKDLERWNATIDRKTLSIHFRSSDTLFLPNSDVLRPQFTLILDDFFPRLIGVLRRSKYLDKIEEIRIEGHTASESGKDKEVDYLEGIILSQNRTTEVLKYCLVQTIRGSEYQEWVRSLTVANGYSNSKPAFAPDGRVDVEASRRVEFRVRTKLQDVIDELVTEGQKYQ